jgi:hypothetical protein
VNSAFRTGVFNPGGGTAACGSVGGVHANAIGYATIDVVAGCSNLLPSDPNYYTTDLLFDNVLIGDYQQIGGSPAGTGPPLALDAAGNPMVHIRAVPEGGGAGIAAGPSPGTNLPYTFYDRYTPAANRTIDRRQPLPSTFAGRFIQGGRDAFATNFTIWREGVTGAGASCASNVNNSTIAIFELVRFDEHENPFVIQYCQFEGCYNPPTLPATSSTGTASSTYPFIGTPDIGGWMYLNLNDGGSPRYSITSHASGTISTGQAATPFGTPRASQNWVTMTMFGSFGSRRMTWELDAAALGNGCSPAVPANPFGPVLPITPAGGLFVCPPNTTLTNGTTTLCTGTNVNPNP